jgi:hypothetical protein
VSDDTQTSRPKDAPADAAAPVVTLADFAAVDFEAPIRQLRIIDPRRLREVFAEAMAEADAQHDEAGLKVFSLLEAVTGIFLRPDDKANVWGPMGATAAWTTAVPSNFSGEQSEVLAVVSERVVNPGLRGRLADIAWSNHRRLGAVGVRAAQAYAAGVEGLLAGEFEPWMAKTELMLAEAGRDLHRMLQIVNGTSKKGKRPDWALQAFEKVYRRAQADLAPVPFVKAAELALHYDLLPEAQIAADAERLAGDVPPETYPEATKKLWVLAARLHEKHGDADARRRCLIEAVEKTLAMRQFVAGSAAAEASWVMDALQELRHVQGVEAQEVELEAELRRLQKASLSEMGQIPIDLGVEGDREATISFFQEVELAEGLKQFALLSQSPDPAALRAAALQGMETMPLMAIMPVSHIDDEGRTATKTPGAPISGEPDDAWFANMIQHAESFRRMRDVAGLIDPARTLLHGRFGIEEKHLAPIVAYSPFVPPSQKPLVILGFARFFQGDFMSAAHLLIPQIEPCLRHVLKATGHDPAKRRDDATEEDLSISGLFSRLSAELGQILTPALSAEIDRVFNRRPGPALRHEFAHGQISAGACFHPDVYYGMWLMFRVCCLFILRRWDPDVVRAIAETS